MTEALERTRAELRKHAEPERVEQLRTFFRTGPGEYGEGDVLIGVRVPASRAVVRANGDDLELADVLMLLHSEIHEERLVALLTMVRRFVRNPDERECIFDLYLANTRYINSWDLVDTSAPHIVGAHLERRSRDVLDRLAASEMLWERRIALLATQHFIRLDQFDDTLRLVEALLADEEDLIHKAAGWMLREIGKRDPALIVRFVERHAATMPRTMLRYAIERLPEDQRRRLMEIG